MLARPAQSAAMERFRLLVAETGQQDRVVRTVRPQELHVGAVVLLAAEAAVGPFDIGPLVPLALAGAGGDVVVSHRRPHEQRQQRVHQRGLAGAVLPDEQRRLSRRPDGVDAPAGPRLRAIEGATVVDFQIMQPEPGPGMAVAFEDLIHEWYTGDSFPIAARCRGAPD
jgi:hypothetical protein